MDFGKCYSDTLSNYTKKEDFEYVLNCVDYYWQEDTAAEVALRKQLFRKDFVDKYEKGKSWMHISF